MAKKRVPGKNAISQSSCDLSCLEENTLIFKIKSLIGQQWYSPRVNFVKTHHFNKASFWKQIKNPQSIADIAHEYPKRNLDSSRLNVTRLKKGGQNWCWWNLLKPIQVCRLVQTWLPRLARCKLLWLKKRENFTSRITKYAYK